MNVLDFSCYGKRDWEKGEHHEQAGERAPAKNVIQEPDTHPDLQRNI